jgi:hypothetical protein
VDDLADKRTIKQWFEEFMAGQGDTELSDLVLNLGEANEYLLLSGGKLDLVPATVRDKGFEHPERSRAFRHLTRTTLTATRPGQRAIWDWQLAAAPRQSRARSGGC